MLFETDLLSINLYQCENAFKTNERYIDNDYLLYVHNGKGKFKIDKTIYKAKIGDLFFCRSRTGNTIIADDATPFLLTGIDFHLKGQFHDVLENMPETINILSHQFSIGLILHMISVFKEGKIYSKEICNCILKTFILETLKNSKLGLKTKENIKINMLGFIEENYNKKITYKDISLITTYHKNSVNRILKSITGSSLREYIVLLRIRKAIELLLYSSKSIGEISEICGYNSTIFFSRQFKDKTGKKPTEFRKRSGTNY